MTAAMIDLSAMHGQMDCCETVHDELSHERHGLGIWINTHFRGMSCMLSMMIPAESVLGELRSLGVSHLIGLPDNSSAGLIAAVSRDSRIQYVCVAREGEAFAVAAGIWVGGKIPIVLIQNTGFLESGDSFRGTALRMRVPLVCLITYRGYGKMETTGNTGDWDAETLSRSDLDSAALVTEPTLRAWGLPFSFLQEDRHLHRIGEAFQKAQELMRPVAVLVTAHLE